MPESSNLTPSLETLRNKVIESLKTVYDPEIPVNIHEMGLIYAVDIREPGNVVIQMTLTSPACPVAGSLPGEVETKIRAIEGVSDVKVDLVWDPPWTPARMSEAARLQLNLGPDRPQSNDANKKFQKLGRMP